MSNPKVSVIVPVYNVLDYLEHCMGSVVGQTLKGIEIIVVDDGSTDGSSEWLDSYCLQHPEITLIHKENGGLMSAWVAGVKRSSGDYIGFVDSDDWIERTMFADLLQCATDYDADIVLCDFRANGRTAVHGIEYGYYCGAQMDAIKHAAFSAPGNSSISMARWNKLFRRNLILDNLRYCESLSRTLEDRYIVPACLLSANSLYYLNKDLYFNSSRPGSNSGMYKQNLLEEIDRVYMVQYQVLSDKGLLDSLLPLWEKAYLDYMRIYLHRNLIGVKGFQRKYESAKRLISSNLAKDRIKAYGEDDQSKIGAVLRIAFGLNSPFLLAIACEAAR